MSTFHELGLRTEILNALEDMGYETPSEIQSKAIPQILQNSNDLKAFAQTGTGKTAAFSLPIIELLDPKSKSPQAIILSPTRELAVQIGDNINMFAKNLDNCKVVTVYGGASIEEQIRKLKKGASIVVGTPGRTVDLIRRNVLKLDQIRWVVLDEADEMLNMGFKEELDKVLEATPESKQTLLFSATFPKEVEAIARNYMSKPVEIAAGQKNKGSDNVTNEFYVVADRNRYDALKRIADMNPDIYGIVFCRTKMETAKVAEKLIDDGYNADALHGDLSQAQRDLVMQKFRNKNLQILVATDVAARGLDVNNLTHVINYKMPDQIETYTHRSGRTGRAGNKGVSLVIVTPRESSKIKAIERKINKKFEQKQVPNGKEICENQLFHLINKVENTEVNHQEIDPYLDKINEKLKDLSREDLIQKFVSVEFNAFLNYYENAIDLNKSTENRNGSANKEGFTRFFINVGRRDKFNPKKLIGLINDREIGPNIEIGQIEILENFSFFELEKNFTDATLDAFKHFKLNDRRVSVEVTHNKKSNKRGRGGNKGPKGSRPPRHLSQKFGRKRRS